MIPSHDCGEKDFDKRVELKDADFFLKAVVKKSWPAESLTASSSLQERVSTAAHASASAARTPCKTHHWADGLAQLLLR